MPRHTADTQSSASSVKPSLRPNLFSDKALNFCLRAAIEHTRSSGKASDPLEHSTVALWEDLYHKYLLKGYSNNSQVPPYNQSLRKIDIVTSYFSELDSHLKKAALVFTEAKRANNGTLKDLMAAEQQLFEYCEGYLKAQRPQGADNCVYGNVIAGKYIRFFLTEVSGQHPTQIVVLKDVFNQRHRLGKDTEYNYPGCELDPIKGGLYLDVSDADGDQVKIRQQFQTIRSKHNPQPTPRPTSSGGSKSSNSRPSTPSDGASSSSGKGGSPMSVDKNSSGQPSPPRAGSPGQGRPRDNRSQSPRDNPKPTPVRQRYPQDTT